MDRNRRVLRRIAVWLSVVLMAACPFSVFAFEGGTYHDFRDGDVSLYLPDGWSSKELDAGESEGMSCEKIARAWDDKRGGTLDLDIYFMIDEVQQDDYIYFDSDEESAYEYYADYGMDAIDAMYGDIHGADGSIASEWETIEPVFFDGQWNGFLVLDVSGSAEYDAAETDVTEEFNHTVYLTASMTDDDEIFVHNMLVFGREDGTVLSEEEKELATEIADEFYEYDYHNQMAGVAEEGDWNWDGDDPPDGGMDAALDIIIGAVAALVPFLISVATIVIIVRRVLKKRRSRVRTTARKAFDQIPKEIKEAQQSFDLDETINRWKKRRAEKDSFSGKEKRTEKRTERRAERREERAVRRDGRTERRSTMQMRTREAETAEQRYYDSLQTLLKTGLLTKAEMHDMIERHERSRTRQRNR